MGDDSSNITYYPPDTACYQNIHWENGTDPDAFKNANCSVSQNMITFLNLTQDIEKYVSAYCTNPPKDDDCVFGFCPNPEIAGPLVRIANYVTGFCLALLIFYSPRRVQEAFWSQILTVYSLLITCLVAIGRSDLTRFHALVVLSLVFSPISVYFVAYAIRSFWSTQHRLESVLGRTRYLRRFIVLLAGVIWLGLFIFAYLPKGEARFSQASCKGSSLIEYFFLITPLLYLWAFTRLVYPVVLFVLILVPMAAAWVIAIYLKRTEIWPEGEPYRPRFVKVWRTVGYYYPFIQFMTVVAFPMGYWVCMVELNTLGTLDNKFSLSFGQVFSLFVAVPPVIQAAPLVGDLWRWFRGLTWVQRIAGPPPKRPTEQGRPIMGMPDLKLGDNRPQIIRVR